MKLSYSTPLEALSLIRPHNRIFIHGSAATPNFLVEQMALHKELFRANEIVCMSVMGNFPIADRLLSEHFHINSLFVSPPIRDAVSGPNGDYIPVFLSDIPELFRRKILPIHVAIIQVSPPDENGYLSLGTSVDSARAAVDMAEIVIAQVNPRMPRTHGDTMVHLSRIKAAVWHESELHEVDYSNSCSAVELSIAKHIAELIEDGSTLQMGIGSIPDTVLTMLHHHKHLGIHTEMLSNGVLPLIECGAVDNSLKKEHPGRTVTSFCIGNRKLYDMINDNHHFAFLDVDYVNEPTIIAKNPSVVAINSCIEMDITGQVCSDSIGTYQYSGVGGQMDFIRGAAMSAGGKPIIALPSRTNKGIPRIVPMLNDGAGVVTTRAHVHWVVTEFGKVNLFGKNLYQRSKALVQLAHPNDRELLSAALFERFGRQ